MDIWCQEITYKKMQKCDMWKLETNNKKLPERHASIEWQKKETQYPGWHKDTTKNGLWGGEDNEVPWGDVWGDIKMTVGRRGK